MKNILKFAEIITQCTAPNTPHAAKYGRGGSKSGSVIVGVLVTIVFIGIVVIFMLGNTRSQSEASRGFSGILRRSSTIQSAITATEAWFQTPANRTAVENRLNAYLANPNGQHYIFGSATTRQSLGNNSRHAFKSQLIYFNKDSGSVKVKITSGRTETGGNDIAGATVMLNLSGYAPPPAAPGSWTDNALYAGNNSSIRSNSNTRMVVEGRATFGAGQRTFQGQMTFTRDRFGNGDVFFEGNPIFTVGPVIFETNAYFNTCASGGGAVTFQQDVGFRRYSSSMSSSSCSERLNNYSINGNGYFSPMDSTTMLENLDISPLVDRKLPPLNFVSGISFLRLSTNSQLQAVRTGEQLNSFVQAAKTTHPQHFFPDTSGHLMVHVDRSMNLSGGGVFNGKVVLYFQGSNYPSLETQRKLFRSGPNASTMLYIEKHFTFNSFGVENSGMFRGLIYLAEGVDNSISFWASNIQGAFITQSIHGAAQFILESGSGTTVIAKDNDAIAAFGPMFGLTSGDNNNSGSGDQNSITIPPTSNLRATVLGVYYH